MAHHQSSELLRVLGQLGDAAWAGTLLPLLRANKSAGAVALACKQLRQLCQGNQKQLKLTDANCQHLEPLELDAFSRRFPACSSVAFTASNANDVGPHLACDLPLLARLPKLQSLQLSINSREASRPARMAPALQLLGLVLPQLRSPQLRSLQLELGDSWTSDSQPSWKMLGATTQLTKLVLGFTNAQEHDGDDDDDDDDDPGFSPQHLPALQLLGSNLQHLELTADWSDPTFPQDCSFLSSFSGLTSLTLPLIKKRSGLAAIRSCTALQQLESASKTELDAAECAALAQLTRLTELAIPPSSDTSALLEALRCLSGLQVLALEAIDSSHLPVLAALTNLTGLGGSWVGSPTEELADRAGGASTTPCPSITQLWITGPFPLAPFPGTKEVQMCDTWQPSPLGGLSQHMKALESFSINSSTEASTFHSLDPSAPEAERVAAMRSLGQLAQLTELQFALNDDAEAAALATACRRVNEIWLCVPRGSSVTALGLVSGLCRLSTLRLLTLCLCGLQLSQSKARLLLAGLSALRELYVSTETHEQQEVWRAAAAAARLAGLPLPAVCQFGVVE